MKSTVLPTRSGAIHQCQTNAAIMYLSLDGCRRVPHSGVRRVFVIIATVLSLVAVSCGTDSVTAGGELLPTPVPAPTVAGQVIELEQPEIQVEAVLIGVSSTETIMVHALPGLDQPLAGDVPAATSIEPMGEAFETEDGLVWWQVPAGTVQGWIQPNVAYRGPAQNITDQVMPNFADEGPFDSAEEAALAVAKQIAADRGASDIIVVSTTEIESPPSATVTVDLLGLGDDSLAGFRPIVASGQATGWQPASIIQASLCTRGVTADGLCI